MIAYTLHIVYSECKRRRQSIADDVMSGTPTEAQVTDSGTIRRAVWFC